MRHSKHTDARLRLATSKSTLLIPASMAEKRRLDRRVAQQTARMPFPGAYASSFEFDRLGARAQARMILKAVHAQHPT